MATAAAKKKQSTHVSHEQETWDDISVHDIDIEINGEVGSLPHIKPRPGYTQRWIRTKVNGEDDAKNLSKKFNQHWRRRDPSTIPSGEAAPSIHVDGVGECIGISGMVLMERPEKISAKYKAQVDARTRTQMESVDQNLFQTHSAGKGFGAPKRVEDTAKVEVGSGMIPDED